MAKKIKIFVGLIVILLLVMIFMSKTIYTMNVPIVTAKMPTNGKLKKYETTTGFTKWSKTEELYSELDGKVEKILVSEGDKVTKGQKLVEFSFDKEQVLDDIKQLEIDKKKILLSIETINLKNEKIKKDIDLIGKDENKSEYISTFQIEQLEKKIDNYKEELAKNKILYESGIIPLSELEVANIELDKLIDEHKNLIIENEQIKIKEQNKFEELKKTKQKELENLNYEIASSNQELKSKDIELQNIENKEIILKTKLEKFNEKIFIVAKKDFIITSISKKVGQFVNENTLLMSFGLGSEFEIECEVSLLNNFVALGDECKLKNSSDIFTGNVSKVTQSEKNKKIVIKIKSDEITAGETFEIKFTKESTKAYNLIANSAVNKDTENYFVYTVKKREGILGEEYYVLKTIIDIIDTDNENTAISSENLFFEPIIILSDKPFSNKATVIVENEGDFYVK